MNCRDFEKILAAYVEEIISSEEKNLAENHLSSCQSCRKAFEELKRTVELVRRLEPVESPPWFTQKMMSRVRAEQKSRKGFLQWLFYPLHIKVPLEAFATVLIAVAAVYLFKASEPEMKSIPIPSVTEHAISKDEPSKLPAEPRSDRRVAAGEVALEGVLKPQKQKGVTQGKAPEEKEGKEELKQRGAEPVLPPIVAMKKEAPEPPNQTSRPSSEQWPSDAQPGPLVERDKKIDSEAKAPGRSEKTDQRAFSAHLQVGALSEKKTLTLEVGLRVRDAKAVIPDVENLLGQLGAQDMKRESLQNTEILTVELQANKIPELLEKLKLLGEVKERGSSPEQPQGTLRITVEIASSP